METKKTLKHKNCHVIKFRKDLELDDYSQNQFEDMCGEILSGEDGDLIYIFEARDFEYFFLCWEDYKNKAILNFFQEKQLVIEDGELSYELMSNDFFTKGDVEELSKEVKEFSVEDDFPDFDEKFCQLMIRYLWWAEFQYMN